MELLRQMEILELLASQAMSVRELAEQFGVSEATIKRDIEDVRNYGADIIADRAKGYRFMNWESCKKMVKRWKEIEQQRVMMMDYGLDESDRQMKIC